MLTDEDKKEITNVVVSFMEELNEWGKYCNAIDKDDALSNEDGFEKMKEKLIVVFDKYCTVKERKFGRPTTISYRTEGDKSYGTAEIIKNIEECTAPNKAIVETEDNVPFKYQYVITKKNGKWLVDSKKRYSGLKKKWVIESL
jgi:hypothetical protein